jgi:hypothetical protein
MALILAPIAADKVNAWTAFMQAMSGPRSAEFDDFNRRYNLTKHEAWLCETPAGAVVVAIHEGPGSAELMPKLAQSAHAFDKWFASNLSEIHNMDLSKPPPGKAPERKLSWKG